jgi:eukaryotic-like serine/threonine-protein kinase
LYKPREADLQYMRIALIERLATPAQVQRALGMLRRITEAGGTAPAIGELLVGEGTITTEQHQALLGRRTEVESAIIDAQSGLHEVPRRLGQYEVMERIGRGGMGAVYKAKQLHMDRIVALKILAAHLTRDRKYIKQFIREARAAGQISHPNIVSVHEVGQAGGHFFICMEYVQGRTLSRELLARGRFKTAEVLDVARQVTAGLMAAEKRKIVHRDIKPDNIMLTPRGNIKVTDLGLAKRLADVTSASQSGWGCGTPYYMAPEQARNSSKVDLRADIYALGATLYHLATGKLPFEGPSSVEVLMRAASDRLIPPSILCAEVPVALSDLIERMMSKDPDGRPPSARALAGEIEEVARAVKSKRASRRHSHRRGGSAASKLLGAEGPSGLIQTAAWALAGLAVIGFLIFVIGRKPRPPEKAPRLPEVKSGNGGPETRPQPGKNGNGDGAEPVVEDTEAEAETREAIKAILEVAGSGKSPEEFGRALELYERHLRTAGRLSTVLKRARGSLVARMEELADSELDQRKYLASEALRWGRPSSALDVFAGLESRWPGTIAAGRLKKIRADEETAAAKLVERLDARFKALAAAERFGRAKSLLAAVREGLYTKCRDWKQSAGKGLPELKKSAVTARARTRRETQGALARLKSAEVRIAVWDFRGALAYLQKEAGKMAKGSRGRRRLELAAARARALQNFKKTVIGRLNKWKTPILDSSFRNRGESRGLVVSRAHQSGLELCPRGNPNVSTWVYWRKMKPNELIRLAQTVFTRRSAEDKLGMALLYISSRRIADAETYLDAVATTPGMRAKLAVHRSELSLLASPDDESAAEKLEKNARAMLAGGRPGTSFAVLGRLLADYRRTSYVAGRRKVLVKLRSEAQRDCVMAGPFTGKVSEILPGALRIEYDFSRDSSRRDWRLARDEKLIRLTWSAVFSGEFRAEFGLAEEGAAGAVLVLTPVTRPGTKQPPAPIRLEPGGPKQGGGELPAAAGSEKVARDVAKLELDIVGADVYWGTPRLWGRSKLPDGLLAALASGQVIGWRLALELPADGGGSVSGAHIDCSFGEQRLESVRRMRAGAARVKLAAAMKVPEGWMREKDLARVADDYRDVPDVAAQAEVARVAALVESNKFREAADGIARLRAMYPLQTDLAPRLQELEEAIGKAGRRKSPPPAVRPKS